MTTEADVIAAIVPSLRTLYADSGITADRRIEKRSIQMMRDLFFTIPDGHVGPYTMIEYTLWDTPHMPQGLILRCDTAPTSTMEVYIEYTYDETTWTDAMLPAGNGEHATIDTGVLYGGALKDIRGDTPPYTGAGDFSVTRFDPGCTVRANVVSLGGATGVKGQLLLYVPRPIITQAAPYTGLVPIGPS